MTLRSNMTDRKRKAHEILDIVKAGGYMPDSRVSWALAVLGDVE